MGKLKGKKGGRAHGGLASTTNYDVAGKQRRDWRE